ncbi:hypothetical protein FNV43_RR17353 [Rhamnella rubrinervis]|uniref:Uncharacterized protein n=1 Tax=Rhamnella rubrinervis TaxID=2594499 RepID=A0A8K0GVN4_9ROSA|nr:hypothetical protein FNV43_RR17353 [Rhamnella rubrinervis]
MEKVKGAKEGSKLSRMMKCFVRVFAKMRDSYVQGMTECSGKFDYGTPITGSALATLPRSYSVSSTRSNDDEDFRELVRAASRRCLGDKLEADLLRKQQAGNKPPMGGGVPNNMPRSQSVGIGRIDEDGPCDFEGDAKLKTDLLYPRSRSYAVNSRRSINAI